MKKLLNTLGCIFVVIFSGIVMFILLAFSLIVWAISESYMYIFNRKKYNYLKEQYIKDKRFYGENALY